MMGGHLPNSEGKIVGDGDDVVHSREDIEKLRPYDPKKMSDAEKPAENH